MGNDGGSIPTRAELVKEAARNPTTSELKATTLEHLAHAWRTCLLSGERLKTPVVSDALGRLMNKDELIKILLPSEDATDDDEAIRKDNLTTLSKANVKSLKDVVELKFDTEDSDDAMEQKWVCPMTKKEFGENTKAVYLVPCGHSFAEAAVKEVGDEKCMECGEGYASNDVIPILPIDETDIAHLMLRMRTLQERGLTHSLKRLKKSKKAAVAEADAPASADIKSKPQKPNGSNGIQNANTASLTAKVLEEQEARNKKRKADKNENLESLYANTKAGHVKKGKNNDFMTRGFSIPAHQK